MIPAYDNIPVNPDGPNMRDYDEVVGTYAIEVPEYFNYGFDVVDRWSSDRSWILGDVVCFRGRCLNH